MVAEVAQSGAQEGSRGGRNEYLPPVAAGSNAGGPMHVAANVAILGEQRRAGVQAHAQRDRAGRKSLVDRYSCCDGAWCRGEGDKEGVSLGVHFDPSVARACLPKSPDGAWRAPPRTPRRQARAGAVWILRRQ